MSLIVCRFIVYTTYNLNLLSIMDVIKVFGTNVRKYRMTSQLSQEKLAELSGLHRTYISDIERFSRSISLSNVQKIADALHIETYKLFVEIEEDGIQK